ncbi:MAG: hypothetical protein PHZ00_02250 [Candidatus Peribacteraceae bacterium]|nr:hypothetical protein [Candidatus Peribacteraceae bacterium]
MSIHLPANHLFREVLGAVAGMAVALLIYLGFQQYSFSTLSGSLVDTSATESSDASPDATASIEAEAQERIAEREKVNADRLAALAFRHAASAASEPETPSAPETTTAEAPTVPGNLTAAVSERERLAQRAERYSETDAVGNPDTSPSIDTVSNTRELAGVPVSTAETVVQPQPVVSEQPPAVTPINQPLPASGPAEEGMIILALLAATAMIRHRRNATQAA